GWGWGAMTMGITTNYPDMILKGFGLKLTRMSNVPYEWSVFHAARLIRNSPELARTLYLLV
ncbi:hypothetical protein, partial [Nostoc sp. NOS(2021)]|uniref:hypothetical protein n=1 Tax=Nostoc sp. NOS(2021) TaxID=2815407 RepID=UPI0025EACE7D